MTPAQYLKLPYTRLVNEINDESGRYWYGKILELDGCQSDGETVEQLMLNLDEAMEGWIETKLAHNLPVPKPREGMAGRHAGGGFAHACPPACTAHAANITNVNIDTLRSLRMPQGALNHG